VDFNDARDDALAVVYQLDYMQFICNLLQTNTTAPHQSIVMA